MAERDSAEDNKSIFKAWHGAMLGLLLVVGVYFLMVPCPVRADEEEGWLSTLAVLVICGAVGGFFTYLNCYLIELRRRCRHYLSTSREEQKCLAQAPLPSHPMSVLVFTALSALVALYTLQTYGGESLAGWTVGIVLANSFGAGMIEALIVKAVPRPNPMDELDASVKPSVLMGQSANFPSEDEHKRTGKFK